MLICAAGGGSAAGKQIGNYRGTSHGQNILSRRGTVFHGSLAAGEVRRMETAGTDPMEERIPFALDVRQYGDHHPLCVFPEGAGERSCAAAGF